ncbi:MAG: hypothetical protein FJZ01_20875, partial [Candidatus Sericytochromatia bacterium]|nr:hypothetical protein [Candidatus Tanganyikabacteria bacterium]
ETFDRFAIHSSNDCFVYPGAQEFAAAWEGGFHSWRLADATEWVQAPKARSDRDLAAMVASLGERDIYYGQAEGMFFATELFREVARLIEREFRPAGLHYTREEVYFATLARHLAIRGGARVADHTYVYSSVVNGHEITAEVVDRVRSGALRGGHRYFGVKRVDRTFDDPLRRYIRLLAEEETAYFDAPDAPMAADLAPPGKRALLHQPMRDFSGWQAVVRAYLQAFAADDPVALVLPVEGDPEWPCDAFVSDLEALLAAEGLDPEFGADIVVRPIEGGLAELAGCYRAADAMAPGTDPAQSARAARLSKPVMAGFDSAAWRAGLAMTEPALPR